MSLLKWLAVMVLLAVAVAAGLAFVARPDAATAAAPFTERDARALVGEILPGSRIQRASLDAFAPAGPTWEIATDSCDVWIDAETGELVYIRGDFDPGPAIGEKLPLSAEKARERALQVASGYVSLEEYALAREEVDPGGDIAYTLRRQDTNGALLGYIHIGLDRESGRLIKILQADNGTPRIDTRPAITAEEAQKATRVAWGKDYELDFDAEALGRTAPALRVFISPEGNEVLVWQVSFLWRREDVVAADFTLVDAITGEVYRNYDDWDLP